MKNVKQKQQTLQEIINAAQTGGGGTVDAYTKAEADAKFQDKADMSDYYMLNEGSTELPYEPYDTTPKWYAAADHKYTSGAWD